MPVPKKKTSQSRRDKRRSHHALKKTESIVCSKCGERKLLHQLCNACGTYKGKEIINNEEE